MLLAAGGLLGGCGRAANTIAETIQWTGVVADVNADRLIGRHFLDDRRLDQVVAVRQIAGEEAVIQAVHRDRWRLLLDEAVHRVVHRIFADRIVGHRVAAHRVVGHRVVGHRVVGHRVDRVAVHCVVDRRWLL